MEKSKFNYKCGEGNHMKKYLTISVLVIALAGLLYLCVSSSATYKITSEEIKLNVDTSQMCYANHIQKSSFIALFEFDSNLYVYIKHQAYPHFASRYEGALSRFEEGKLQIVTHIEGTVIGQHETCVFYWVPADSTRHNVYSYDLVSNTTQYVAQIETDQIASLQMNKSGVLFFPDVKNDKFYRLYNDHVGALDGDEAGYVMNEKRYFVDSGMGTDDVLCIEPDDKNGVSTLDLPYGKKSIIPCSKGLIVHNQGQGQLLYLILPTGEVRELFSHPSLLSNSSFNIHKDIVYLSVERYQYNEETDSTVLIDNDDQSGTFLIDLSDLSVRKISDEFYSALYIFDESGIYAADSEGNIFKLDFDGRIIDTLLFHP